MMFVSQKYTLFEVSFKLKTFIRFSPAGVSYKMLEIVRPFITQDFASISRTNGWDLVLPPKPTPPIPGVPPPHYCNNKTLVWVSLVSSTALLKTTTIGLRSWGKDSDAVILVCLDSWSLNIEGHH